MSTDDVWKGSRPFTVLLGCAAGVAREREHHPKKRHVPPQGKPTVLLRPIYTSAMIGVLISNLDSGRLEVAESC